MKPHCGNLGNAESYAIALRAILAGTVVAMLAVSGMAQAYNAEYGEAAKYLCGDVPEISEKIYLAKASGMLKAELKANYENAVKSIIDTAEDKNGKAIASLMLVVRVWLVERAWGSSSESYSVRRTLATVYQRDCQEMLYDFLVDAKNNEE